jgi:hypothetical protein
MTMKLCLMLAAGTVLAGSVLAGCGPGGSGTATGSRTASPGGSTAGSATPTQTPATSGTSATVPASAAAPSAAVAACTAPDLRVRVALSLRSDDKHHAGVTLQLTNSSSHACALDGYPGLRLLNFRSPGPAYGHPLGQHLVRGRPRKPVDLAPGQAAQTGLGWTHTGSSAVRASYLEVTPPDSATHLTISFRQRVDGGDLDVTALAADDLMLS